MSTIARPIRDTVRRRWLFADGTTLPIVAGGDGPATVTPNSPAWFAQHRQRLLDEADTLTKNRTDDLVGDDLSRFEQIGDQLEALARHEAAVARVTAAQTGTAVRGADQMDADGEGGAHAASFNVNRRSVEPWADLDRSGSLPAAEVRTRALAAVEQGQAIPDAARERFTVELERSGGEPLDRLSRWTLATSSPAYLRAFLKLAADPENGHREFTDEELGAFRHARTLGRAMSLTDTAGGYLVPFQLDPTVILTSAGGTNPIRQIARKVIATGDVWNGVSSAGITASWDAEAAEVSDDAPTLAGPAVPVWKMQAFVPISIEAFEDALNVATEIGTLLADGADVLEAEALQVGSGAGQPTGVVTALTGTASVVSQTGTTLDAPDFRATQEALGARFQASASWVMHLASMNRARSIVAGTGLTTPLLNDDTDPPRLLGKGVYEGSFMDSTVTASASDNLAVYGDFSPSTATSPTTCWRTASAPSSS